MLRLWVQLIDVKICIEDSSWRRSPRKSCPIHYNFIGRAKLEYLIHNVKRYRLISTWVINWCLLILLFYCNPISVWVSKVVLAISECIGKLVGNSVVKVRGYEVENIVLVHTHATPSSCAQDNDGRNLFNAVCFRICSCCPYFGICWFGVHQAQIVSFTSLKGKVWLVKFYVILMHSNLDFKSLYSVMLMFGYVDCHGLFPFLVRIINFEIWILLWIFL